MALVKFNFEGGIPGTVPATSTSFTSGGTPLNTVNGTAVGYSANYAAHGQMSVKFAGASTSYIDFYTNTDSSNVGAFRVYMLLTAYPTTSSQIMNGLNSGGNTNTVFFLNSDGTISFRGSSTATMAFNGTVPIPLKTWVRLEFRYHNSSGNWYWDWYIGDSTTSQETFTLTGTGGMAAGLAEGVRVGRLTGASTTWDAYFDDLAVRTGGLGYTPIGPETVTNQTIIKQNNANGGSHTTVVTAANSGGASGDAFTSVTGTTTYDSTQRRLGTGVSYNMVASQANRYLTYEFTATSKAAARIYIYKAGASASNPNLINFYSGTTPIFRLYISSEKLLTVINPSASIVAEGTVNLPQLRWLRIEASVDLDANTYTWAFYNGDSTVPIEKVVKPNTFGDVATVDRVHIGNIATARQINAYVDDIAVGTGGTELIGPTSHETVIASNNFDHGTHGASVTLANLASTGQTAPASEQFSAGVVRTYSTADPLHSTALSMAYPTSGAEGYYNWTLPQSVERVVTRFYVKPAATLAAGQIIGQWTNSGGGAVRLYLSTNGQVYLTNINLTQIADSVAYVPLGQWLRVEVEHIRGRDTTNGVLGYRIFSGDSTTLVAQYRGNVDAGTSELNAFLLGRPSTDTMQTTVLYDELWMGTTSGWPAIPTTSTPSTTPVSTTIATSWNTEYTAPLTAVSTTRATEWAVKSAVADTNAEAWAVRTQVTDTNATTFGVRSLVTDSIQETFSVRTSTSDIASTTWAVKSNITDTVYDTWHIRSSVVDTSSDSWNTRSSVVSTRSTLWGVDEIAKVVATNSTGYAVRTVASQTAQESWTVQTSVSTENDALWAVRGRTAATVADSFTVRAQVSDTTATVWAVGARIASTVAETWSVAGPIVTVTDNAEHAPGVTTFDVHNPNNWLVAGSAAGIYYTDGSAFAGDKVLYGGWSYRHTSSGGSAIGLQTGAKEQSATARVYVNIPTLPTNSIDIITFTDGATTQARVRLVVQAGSVRVAAHTSGGAVTVSSAAMPLNTTVRIETRTYMSGTTRWITAEWFLGDSLTRADQANSSATSPTQNGVDTAYFGKYINNSGTPAFFFDDLGFRTGSTTFIGPPSRQVVDTISTAWNVRTKITPATQPTDWAIRSRLTDTLDTTWGARQVVSDTLLTRWGIRTPVEDTNSTEWGVRIFADPAYISTGWDLFAPATNEVEDSWDVRAVTEKNVATRWRVLGPIQVVRVQAAVGIHNTTASLAGNRSNGIIGIVEAAAAVPDVAGSTASVPQTSVKVSVPATETFGD